MYVFLERDRREKRWQIFAQFGGSTCYRLVVGNKKKEREKNIYLAAIIHWLSSRERKKVERNIPMLMSYSFIFTYRFFFFYFCVHEYSKTTTRIFYQ
jgi:hypothetical protein